MEFDRQRNILKVHVRHRFARHHLPETAKRVARVWARARNREWDGGRDKKTRERTRERARKGKRKGARESVQTSAKVRGANDCKSESDIRA